MYLFSKMQNCHEPQNIGHLLFQFILQQARFFLCFMRFVMLLHQNWGTSQNSACVLSLLHIINNFKKYNTRQHSKRGFDKDFLFTLSDPVFSIGGSLVVAKATFFYERLTYIRYQKIFFGSQNRAR